MQPKASVADISTSSVLSISRSQEIHFWQNLPNYVYLEINAKSRGDDVDLLNLYFAVNPKNDINAKDEVGNTALLWAVVAGLPKICSFLIAHGADANLANDTHWTPLHFAAVKGNLDCAKILVEESNADLKLRTGKDQTAVDIAREHGFTELVSYLQEKAEDEL